MYSKLNELAEIFSGYTFRNSIKDENGGVISVLQAKDVLANVVIQDTSFLTKVSDSSFRNPLYLKNNDVLITSRGAQYGSFKSTVFVSDNPMVMPSSSLVVIRIPGQNLLPKYLSWYLNSDGGQKAIMQLATGGSFIRSILPKKLGELTIPLPNLEIQKSIIVLHENMEKQEKLLTRKHTIIQKVINAQLINLSNNKYD